MLPQASTTTRSRSRARLCCLLCTAARLKSAIAHSPRTARRSSIMPAASRTGAGEHTPLSHSLAATRSALFVSILSDCLALAGATEQALPCRIRPLDEASIMVGRARTAQFMEVEGHTPHSNPYELEI